jgi:hypothetical protein
MKFKLFSALIFAAAVAHLNATEIVTASYAAWTATVSGAPAEWDFSFSGGTSYSTAAGYTLNAGSYGPLTVTGPDGSGYSLNENPAYFDSTTSQTVTTLESASDGVGSMVFTAPSAGLTAFALGLGELGVASPITIALSDGETFTANPGVNGDLFLGFSSATAITSFTLSTTGGSSAGSSIELTDFDAGASSQPEPAAELTTGIMIGSGLLFFLARGRKFSSLFRAQP